MGFAMFAGNRCFIAVCCFFLAMLFSGAKAATLPGRVVSMNLCTDQLAILLAGPGQLHSVSWLAADSDLSVLAEQAGQFVLNHGSAEEIYLLKPDLVLAGTYSRRSSVNMLKHMGFHVEEFAPAYSFEDIRKTVIRLGHLLHRQTQAARLVAEMESRLAAIPYQSRAKTAAFYYRGGYTAGAGTLEGQIVKKAGLDNLAEKLEINGIARLPLEILVLNRPDYLVRELPRYKAGLQEFRDGHHPALAALSGKTKKVVVPGQLIMCGGPFTADAVKLLADVQDD